MSQSIHEFFEYIITDLYEKSNINAIPQYIRYDKTQYSDAFYIRFLLNNSLHNVHLKFNTIEEYKLKCRIEKINKIKKCIRLKK